jgi:hypothetical protein
MKIDRITIEVEAPAGVVDHEKLLGLVRAELYSSMHGIPHQAQSWVEPSPNTRIGDALEPPTASCEQRTEEALLLCEKCSEPMHNHDRWNRCPVACDKCGKAMQLHGAPGSGCPWPLANYLVQAHQAEVQMAAMHSKLLADGYKETAPGVLTSPDGETTVEW